MLSHIRRLFRRQLHAQAIRLLFPTHTTFVAYQFYMLDFCRRLRACRPERLHHGFFLRPAHHERVESAPFRGETHIIAGKRLAPLFVESAARLFGLCARTLAVDAMRRGIHVAMVSKETDSVVGPDLNDLARVLGFEIIAAGKASEYDYTVDPATGNLRYVDRTLASPALNKLWCLGGDVAAQLRKRRAALGDLPQSATPDYCEMNIVANSTGLAPACDELSYPLCRITELADVFIPEQDGGVLKRTGVVDVFNCLRRTDEPSFGGGVFVVVRCTDAPIWELLRQKGHVVSRSGNYACIYRPYHLMGLEAPLSLFSTVLHHRPSGSSNTAVHAVMVACAKRESGRERLCAWAGTTTLSTVQLPYCCPPPQRIFARRRFTLLPVSGCWWTFQSER